MSENVKESINILLSGVGGQGILLASEITAFALIRAGFEVRKSEVHGMAQRGGSVVAHLRFGERVYSPLIDPGTTDIQVAFEMMEALRYLPMLKKDSRVIVNTQKIAPLSVSTGQADYPDDAVDVLRGKGLSVYPVDALETAESIGELRTVNIVLVGALSSFLPVDEQIFLDVISEKVKKDFVEVNRNAFVRGREITRKFAGNQRA